MNENAKLDPDCATFYQRAVELLRANDIPVLLGGAYALCLYTGLARHTKDVDFFLRALDVDRTLSVFEQHGFRAEKTFPHWLAKIRSGENFVDLIFAAGNGLCEVDDSWFDRGRTEDFLGQAVKVIAPEEIIWVKAFIQERERFDGRGLEDFTLIAAESRA